MSVSRFSNHVRSATCVFVFAMVLGLGYAPAQGQSPKLSAPVSDAARVSTAPPVQPLSNLPLYFEENRGQTDSRVKFLSRGRGYTLFLTGDEAVLALRKKQSAASSKPPAKNEKSANEAAVLRMRISGAKQDATVEGIEPLPGKIYYASGKETGPLQGNATFKRVKYAEVYPGIDLEYYGNPAAAGRLEFDFVVAPHADPKHIRLSFAGTEKIALTSDGELSLSVAGEEVRLKKPAIYQERNGQRTEIAGGYVLTGKGKREAIFDLAPYDSSLPLVIDPQIDFATYLGGGQVDDIVDLRVLPTGEIYVLSHTQQNTGFPTTQTLIGPFGGGQLLNDCFVTKLSPDGGTLLYSLAIQSSWCFAMAVDLSGEVHLSVLFPTGPALTTLVQDSTGTFLFWPLQQGTFNPFELAQLMEADSQGNVYMVIWGSAASGLPHRLLKVNASGQLMGDFPILTPGVFSVPSSVPGGPFREDAVTGLAVDDSGHAFVIGYAGSPSVIPTTQNAFQLGRQDNCSLTGTCIVICPTPTSVCQLASGDGFVMEIDTNTPNNFTVAYASYLGGALYDYLRAVALGPGGSLYILGETQSLNFPTTPGALVTDLSLSNGRFVLKLDLTQPPAQQLRFGTFLPPTYLNLADTIAVLPGGLPAVLGNQAQVQYANPLYGNGTVQDESGPFVLVLSNDASAVHFLGHLQSGASFPGRFSRLVSNGSGRLYVAGHTTDTRLGTAGAFQPNLAGNYDILVRAISGIANLPPVANAQSVSTEMDQPVAIRLTGSDAEGDPLTFFFGTTQPAFGLLSGTPPFLTYTPFTGFMGTDSFTFYVNDGFNDSAEATVTILVKGPPTDLSLDVVASPSLVIVNNTILLTATITNLGPNDATNVTLSGLGFIISNFGNLSATSSHGSCSNISVPGTPLVCSLGNMLPGDIATIDVLATPTAALLAGGTSVITVGMSASVAATETDTDPSNNTSSGTFIVASSIFDVTSTQPGTAITLSPLSTPPEIRDPTGLLRPATIRFDNITTPGFIWVQTRTHLNPPPPAGLQAGSPPYYFDLGADFTFSGNVNLCLDIRGMSFAHPAGIQLHQYVNGNWTQLTPATITPGTSICANAFPSLGLFAIFYPQVSATAISTVVGNGVSCLWCIDGPGGDPSDELNDGSQATSVAFPFPYAISLDRVRNYLYVTSGNPVYRVDLNTGIINRVVGSGFPVGTIDGVGGDPRDDIVEGGDPLNTTNATIAAMAVDSSGNLILHSSCRIRKVNFAANTVHTIGGNGDCNLSPYGTGDGLPATSTNVGSINFPAYDVESDASGNVFIPEYGGHRIRRIDAATGIITTIAGNGLTGPTASGVHPTQTSLEAPVGIAFDTQGHLLVLAGNQVPFGAFYFGLFRISPGADGVVNGSVDETITQVAGCASCPFPFQGDNRPAMEALLRAMSVSVASDGAVLLSGFGGTGMVVVRRISPGADNVLTGAADEIINTVAGFHYQFTSAFSYFNGDTFATQAQLAGVTDAIEDAQGRVLVVDSNNSRVRRFGISPFLKPNRPPVANAGADQTVFATSPAGATVTLDGSASSDPDPGQLMQFTWTGPFGTLSGQSISPTLPIGTHTITLTVDDGLGGTSSDTVVVTVLPQRSADLSVTVDANPNPVPVGQPVTITAVITNNGPDAATNVAFSGLDNIMTNFSVVSATPTQGTCPTIFTAGPLQCSLGALAGGQSATLIVVASPTPAVFPSPSTLSVSVGAIVSVGATEVDPDANNNVAATVFNARQLSADLSTTVSANPNPVPVGQPVTITAVITNNGPDAATNVTWDAQFALQGFSNFSLSASQGGCTGDVSTPLQCLLATLAANASATITVVATPTQVVMPPNFNSISVGLAANVAATEPDPNPANNSSSFTFGVRQLSADVSVGLAVPTSPVAVGQRATIIVNVMNLGPDAASNVTLDAQIDLQGFTNLTFTVGQAGCTGDVNTPLQCLFGTLPPQASRTVIIEATPTVAAFPSNFQTKSVGAHVQVSASEPDPDTTNNRADAGFGIRRLVADVALFGGSISPLIVPVGQQVTISASIINNGPDPATNVTFSGLDYIMANFNVSSATSTQGSCAPITTSPLQCDLGTLALGQTATVTVVATPPQTLFPPGSTLLMMSVGANVSVNAPELDLDMTNNTASTGFNVRQINADLSVTLSANPSLVDVGQQVSIVATITNNGPDAATNVAFSGLDYIMTTFSVASATPTQGTCPSIFTTGPLQCSLGTLASGQSATLTVAASPTQAVFPPGFTLPTVSVGANVSVSATELDPNPANNTASTGFGVVTPPNNPPTANAGADQVVEATSAAGAQVTLSGTGSDPDGDPLTFAWSGPCGSASVALATLTCPLGSSTMTLTVSDGRGGTASDTVFVTVRDTTPPTLTLPANITAAARSSAGAAVNYAATATDLVHGALVPSCSPAPGATFPIGMTTVNCLVADASGNSASGSFSVTVKIGLPRVFVAIPAKGRDSSGNYYLDLRLTNTGDGHARNVRVNTLTFRTLLGSGTVSYNASLSGALPLAIGSLDVGASSTIRLYLTVPSTVTRFSITESGMLENVTGTVYSYTTAQAVFP